MDEVRLGWASGHFSAALEYPAQYDETWFESLSTACHQPLSPDLSFYYFGTIFTAWSLNSS